MGPELRTGSGARPPRASGRGGARAASLGRPGPDVASLRPCPRPRRSAGQGRSRRLSGEPVGYLVASSGPRSGRMPGGGAGGSQSGLGDVAEGKRGGGPGRSHPAGAGHHGGERPPGPARAAGPGPGLLPRLAPRLRARRAPPAAGGGRGAAGLPELGGGGGAEAGAGARAAAPPLPVRPLGRGDPRLPGDGEAALVSREPGRPAAGPGGRLPAGPGPASPGPRPGSPPERLHQAPRGQRKGALPDMTSLTRSFEMKSPTLGSSESQGADEFLLFAVPSLRGKPSPPSK
ncbi:alpha-ketoglutarate-dependent dioxygenase alkB homolog 7, mitochondrial isoform X2 [Macrotis lagotis]|uniref:alpha-ketoglutarate-dependent dioxygenase alkB homolog 7, mitochondrial isoform X2 n=1 Tax=Macrotis lagotis TaxID=92651 RepID=UPI003D699646